MVTNRQWLVLFCYILPLFVCSCVGLMPIAQAYLPSPASHILVSGSCCVQLALSNHLPAGFILLGLVYSLMTVRYPSFYLICSSSYHLIGQLDRVVFSLSSLLHQCVEIPAN